jgi:hypothetical protein
VQGDAGVGAQQQVLAAGHHLADDLAGEVGGGHLRHAEVGGDQALAGERLVEPAGGLVDGVSLWHADQPGPADLLIPAGAGRGWRGGNRPR